MGGYLVYTREERLENELMYNGAIVVKYEIIYPQFTSSTYFSFINYMNEYYQIKARELADYCENYFFSNAVANYEEVAFGRFPFRTHKLNQDFNITMNENCIVSLYTDTETYTGEANMRHARTSDNWDVMNEKRIPIAELFQGEPYYEDYMKEMIIRLIENQLRSGTDNYFPDYKRMVEENFRVSNFYMTPHELIVFFDELTIAPHSSGIVTFEIVFVKGPIKPGSC